MSSEMTKEAPKTKVATKATVKKPAVAKRPTKRKVGEVQLGKPDEAGKLELPETLDSPEVLEKQDKQDEPEKPSHNREVGTRGEEAAASYLKRAGIHIRDRNWRCSAGEVDIVAEEEGSFVFIEVKTRANCDYGFPEEAVDLKKRKRYEKIAGYYLKDNDVADKAVRFDVIAILVIAPERAFLRHHRNAFVTC